MVYYWCNFDIDQIKGKQLKSCLKMLGIVQKKMYRDTLIYLPSLRVHLKGRERGNDKRSERREENACKDAIVFSVFYVHQMNVRILIGQN